MRVFKLVRFHLLSEGVVMTERKVDVMDKTGKVLHTYPITIGTSNPSPKAIHRLIESTLRHPNPQNNL
jgi:hypothetical protein